MDLFIHLSQYSLPQISRRQTGILAEDTCFAGICHLPTFHSRRTQIEIVRLSVFGSACDRCNSVFKYDRTDKYMRAYEISCLFTSRLCFPDLLET